MRKEKNYMNIIPKFLTKQKKWLIIGIAIFAILAMVLGPVAATSISMPSWSAAVSLAGEYTQYTSPSARLRSF